MTLPPQRPSTGAPGNIAERLRRAREECGLSLDELAIKTRIPLRHLETIEAGRGPDLPGGFIGKSFVRQYAEAVGLDAEQTLREFVAQTGVNLDVAFEERKVSPFTPESIQKFQSKVWRNIGIGAAAVLVVVVALAYLLFGTKKEQPAEEPAPQPTASRPLPSYLEPETQETPQSGSQPSPESPLLTPHAASTAASPTTTTQANGSPTATAKPFAPAGTSSAPPSASQIIPAAPAAARAPRSLPSALPAASAFESTTESSASTAAQAASAASPPSSTPTQPAVTEPR